MNIQDAVAISLDEITGEETHVSGKTDDLDLVSLERGDDFPIVLLAASSAALDDDCFQASLICPIQASCVCLVTNHQRDFSSRNAAFVYGVSEREHV
jgi:hypothetical protein